MIRRLMMLTSLAMISVTMPAQAGVNLGSESIRAAQADTTAIETIACVRPGWRGWGVYPGCYRPPVYAYAAPVYAGPPVYVETPVYAARPRYVAPPRRCWIRGAWRVC